MSLTVLLLETVSALILVEDCEVLRVIVVPSVQLFDPDVAIDEDSLCCDVVDGLGGRLRVYIE